MSRSGGSGDPGTGTNSTGPIEAACQVSRCPSEWMTGRSWSWQVGSGQLGNWATGQLGAVTWECVLWLLLGSGPTRSGGADDQKSERGKRRSGDVKVDSLRARPRMRASNVTGARKMACWSWDPCRICSRERFRLRYHYAGRRGRFEGPEPRQAERAKARGMG